MSGSHQRGVNVGVTGENVGQIPSVLARAIPLGANCNAHLVSPQLSQQHLKKLGGGPTLFPLRSPRLGSVDAGQPQRGPQRHMEAEVDFGFHGVAVDGSQDAGTILEEWTPWRTRPRSSWCLARRWAEHEILVGPFDNVDLFRNPFESVHDGKIRAPPNPLPQSAD